MSSDTTVEVRDASPCSYGAGDVGRMSFVEIDTVPPTGVNLQALLEKFEPVVSFFGNANTNLVRLVTICLSLVSSPVTIPSALGCSSTCFRTASGVSPRASYDACLAT